MAIQPLGEAVMRVRSTIGLPIDHLQRLRRYRAHLRGRIVQTVVAWALAVAISLTVAVYTAWLCRPFVPPLH